jgi:carbonic anhydrase/acetyltransferase-like protein (isoleucine patch superfamily)
MLQAFEGKSPRVADSALIQDSAVLIGDVVIAERSSVWFHTVIRGDIHFIRIGERTNIQDLSLLHVKRGEGPVVVGNGVTVGHRAVLHACKVDDNVLVGIGAIILDGAQVGSDSVVGAGSLVPPGKIIPPRSFVLGSPARVVRPVTSGEMDWIRDTAERYVNYTHRYKAQVGAPPTGDPEG